MTGFVSLVQYLCSVKEKTCKIMANEIVLYQPNEQMSLEVKLENETVWLTLNQMASLFG